MDDSYAWTAAETVFVPSAEGTHDPAPDGSERPNVFLQWKGTDVCFDFWCPCGGGGHFDGYFAYQFRCPECGRVFVMPSTIYPAVVDEALTDRSAPRSIDDGENAEAKPHVLAEFEGHPERVVYAAIEAHAKRLGVDTTEDLRWVVQATRLADDVYQAIIAAGFRPPETKDV